MYYFSLRGVLSSFDAFMRLLARHFLKRCGKSKRKNRRLMIHPTVKMACRPMKAEWIDAWEAQEVLGRTCVSMLSTSLRLYFEMWERELGIRGVSRGRKRRFKGGFLNHYKTYFEKILRLSWVDCPANLELIEQLILARNREQHPEEIFTMSVRYSKKDLEKTSAAVFHELNLKRSIMPIQKWKESSC